MIDPITPQTTPPDPRASVNDNQRRTRLALYQASEAMQSAIGMIDTTDEIKAELKNTAIVNLRMALAVSDGCVSPFPMRTW